MFIITYDVTLRYFFSAPTEWAFDYAVMLYGTCFMLCGAYTLAQNNHVRSDMVYRLLSVRQQATLDLVLWLSFFPWHHRADGSWLLLCRNVVALSGAFAELAGRPTDLSFQDGHTHRRFLYWPAGHCGSPALSCRHSYWPVA